MATLIVLPDTDVVISDDADTRFDIDADVDLTGVPLVMTIREDPDWPNRRLVSEDKRREYEADVSGWTAVYTTTTTVPAGTGYAAAMAIDRTSAALLEPGRYRYCLEIARTDSGSVSPVVLPQWVSVRSAVAR